MHNLTQDSKRLRLKVDGTSYAKTAGTTDTLTSEAVDTSGYQSALFRIGFGAITGSAVTGIKVQSSTDDGSTDAYADLTGTAQAPADTDDNKVFEVEIHRSTERYLKFITTRATANVVVDFLEVFLYNPTRSAPTQDSTVGGTERFNSPVVGGTA